MSFISTTKAKPIPILTLYVWELTKSTIGWKLDCNDRTTPVRGQATDVNDAIAQATNPANLMKLKSEYGNTFLITHNGKMWGVTCDG